MTSLKTCPSPIGKFTNVEGETVLTSCKSWKCPYCSRVKKKRLLDRVRVGFKGFRTYTATLTEVKRPDNESRARAITKHWNRLRSSLRKRGYNVERFFWSKEFKPLRGSSDPTLYPHLHVLLTADIPKALIEELWYKATDKTAYQIYYDETCDVSNAGGYMAKYMTKSAFNDGFQKGERRYGFSHGHFPDMTQTVSGVDFEGKPFSFVKAVKGVWKFQLQYGIIRGERNFKHDDVATWDGGGYVLRPFAWKNSFTVGVEKNCIHDCFECKLTRLCSKYAQPIYPRRSINHYDT